MRIRTIRRLGNSFYVKLEQADMKDWNLSPGDEVEVTPSPPTPAPESLSEQPI